ncbi:MAG: SGNH/GDSL hydrolase family protein [Patescibacteria group bacterium]
MAQNYLTKIYLIIGLLAVLSGGIYLNRAYAYIYQTIGGAHLKEFDLTSKYMINNEGQSTSSLIYVALGDSLTAGVGAYTPEDSWPYLVAKKLAGSQEKVILKSQAVPGFKTSDVVSELLEQTIVEKPDLVTVLIGVNDLHNQVSPRDFQSNYEQILSRLTKETKAKIYLVNLPYIGADTLIRVPYNFYFDHQTRAFNQIIKKLAAKYLVSYVDLYTTSFELFKKSGDHYSADLFHPSAKGYQIWADIIYDSINQ